MKSFALACVKKWIIIAILFCVLALIEGDFLVPCAALISFEITVRMKKLIDWLFSGSSGGAETRKTVSLGSKGRAFHTAQFPADSVYHFDHDDREFLFMEANSSPFL